MADRLGRVMGGGGSIRFGLPLPPSAFASMVLTRMTSLAISRSSASLRWGSSRGSESRIAMAGGTLHPLNILPMCPNHHRAMDRNRLAPAEMLKIQHMITAARENPLSRKIA